MQKEANFETAGSEVAMKLTLGGLVKLGGGLDFDDKLFINDHIEPLSTELSALVHDTDANLPADAMAASQELTLERHCVDMLEKPETQRVVCIEEGADHRACKGFFK